VELASGVRSTDCGVVMLVRRGERQLLVVIIAGEEVEDESLGTGVSLSCGTE